MLIRILGLFFIIISFFSVKDISWSRILDVELVEKAELIVQGEIFKDDNIFYIKTESVLKGLEIDTVKLRTPSAWLLQDIVLKEEQVGLFFLRKVPDENLYRFFHPACIKNNEYIGEIQRAFDIWENPQKYMTGFEEESIAVNYVLGKLFAGWQVYSEEAPLFAKSLNSYYKSFSEEALWEENNTVNLTVSIDDDNNCLIESDNPGLDLSKVFEKRVEIASKWDDNKKNLPNEFIITIDHSKTNLPAISYEQATSHLTDQLESKDRIVVLYAIDALTTIGDTACIPRLIPLIRSSESTISLRAIRALGWSKSNFAIDPIGLLMVENCVFDIRQHQIPNTAAEALKNINQPSCIPYLEEASKFGVQRACEAVGQIGTTASVSILIASLKQNPKECNDAVNALYKLVLRSNHEVEGWMKPRSSGNGLKQMERIPLWINWYESLSDDFKIIKTFKEALAERNK